MSVNTTGNPFNQRFTMVPNFLIRKLAVSFEARMMLIYIMSHEEGYLLRVAQIAEETGRCKDTIQKLMRELEDFGVLKRRQLRASGRITGTAYELDRDLLWGLTEDPGDPPRVPPGADDSGPGPDLPEQEFSQVTPEPEVPAQVDQSTKKTTSKKTKNQEDQVLASAPPPPEKANEILATLIDACSAHNVTLPPRIKGMYARKFKELLDGGVPAPLILEALRLSWRKKTVDRVQLLDNYLIEVQAGERVRDVRTNSQVRSDNVGTLVQQTKAVVLARGGNPDDNRLMVKTMRDIRNGLIDVAQAIAAPMQMQLGVA